MILEIILGHDTSGMISRASTSIGFLATGKEIFLLTLLKEVAVVGGGNKLTQTEYLQRAQ